MPPVPTESELLDAMSALLDAWRPRDRAFRGVKVMYCPMADREHAQSPRQYAHWGCRPRVVCLARAYRELPADSAVGVLAHELGHALADAYPDRARAFGDEEMAADAMAEALLGIKIRYDRRKVQTVPPRNGAKASANPHELPSPPSDEQLSSLEADAGRVLAALPRVPPPPPPAFFQEEDARRKLFALPRVPPPPGANPMRYRGMVAPMPPDESEDIEFLGDAPEDYDDLDEAEDIPFEVVGQAQHEFEHHLSGEEERRLLEKLQGRANPDRRKGAAIRVFFPSTGEIHGIPLNAIQSVIFDRARWSKPRARQWLASHGLKHDDEDFKPKSIRYRQTAPSGGPYFTFAVASTRTQTGTRFMPAPRKTIKLVMRFKGVKGKPRARRNYVDRDARWVANDLLTDEMTLDDIADLSVLASNINTVRERIRETGEYPDPFSSTAGANEDNKPDVDESFLPSLPEDSFTLAVQEHLRAKIEKRKPLALGRTDVRLLGEKTLAGEEPGLTARERLTLSRMRGSRAGLTRGARRFLEQQEREQRALLEKEAAERARGGFALAGPPGTMITGRFLGQIEGTVPATAATRLHGLQAIAWRSAAAIRGESAARRDALLDEFVAVAEQGTDIIDWPHLEGSARVMRDFLEAARFRGASEDDIMALAGEAVRLYSQSSPDAVLRRRAARRGLPSILPLAADSATTETEAAEVEATAARESLPAAAAAANRARFNQGGESAEPDPAAVDEVARAVYDGIQGLDPGIFEDLDSDVSQMAFLEEFVEALRSDEDLRIGLGMPPLLERERASTDNPFVHPVFERFKEIYTANVSIGAEEVTPPETVASRARAASGFREKLGEKKLERERQSAARDAVIERLAAAIANKEKKPKRIVRKEDLRFGGALRFALSQDSSAMAALGLTKLPEGGRDMAAQYGGMPWYQRTFDRAFKLIQERARPERSESGGGGAPEGPTERVTEAGKPAPEKSEKAKEPALELASGEPFQPGAVETISGPAAVLDSATWDSEVTYRIHAVRLFIVWKDLAFGPASVFTKSIAAKARGLLEIYQGEVIQKAVPNAILTLKADPAFSADGQNPIRDRHLQFFSSILSPVADSVKKIVAEGLGKGSPEEKTKRAGDRLIFKVRELTFSGDRAIRPRFKKKGKDGGGEPTRFGKGWEAEHPAVPWLFLVSKHHDSRQAYRDFLGIVVSASDAMDAVKADIATEKEREAERARSDALSLDDASIRELWNRTFPQRPFPKTDDEFKTAGEIDVRSIEKLFLTMSPGEIRAWLDDRYLEEQAIWAHLQGMEHTVSIKDFVARKARIEQIFGTTRETNALKDSYKAFRHALKASPLFGSSAQGLVDAALLVHREFESLEGEFMRLVNETDIKNTVVGARFLKRDRVQSVGVQPVASRGMKNDGTPIIEDAWDAVGLNSIGFRNPGALIFKGPQPTALKGRYLRVVHRRRFRTRRAAEAYAGTLANMLNVPQEKTKSLFSRKWTRPNRDEAGGIGSALADEVGAATEEGVSADQLKERIGNALAAVRGSYDAFREAAPHGAPEALAELEKLLGRRGRVPADSIIIAAFELGLSGDEPPRSASHARALIMKALRDELVGRPAFGVEVEVVPGRPDDPTGPLGRARPGERVQLPILGKPSTLALLPGSELAARGGLFSPRLGEDPVIDALAADFALAVDGVMRPATGRDVPEDSKKALAHLFNALSGKVKVGGVKQLRVKGGTKTLEEVTVGGELVNSDRARDFPVLIGLTAHRPATVKEVIDVVKHFLMHAALHRGELERQELRAIVDGFRALPEEIRANPLQWKGHALELATGERHRRDLELALESPAGHRLVGVARLEAIQYYGPKAGHPLRPDWRHPGPGERLLPEQRPWIAFPASWVEAHARGKPPKGLRGLGIRLLDRARRLGEALIDVRAPADQFPGGKFPDDLDRFAYLRHLEITGRGGQISVIRPPRGEKIVLMRRSRFRSPVYLGEPGLFIVADGPDQTRVLGKWLGEPSEAR